MREANNSQNRQMLNSNILSHDLQVDGIIPKIGRF